jgi:hypothetical protein
MLSRLVQPASITQTFGILAVRGAGKTNAGRVMAEQMFDLKLPFVAVDPVGSWYGLRASRDGKTPGLPIPIFGGRHGDIPLDVGSGAMLADLIVEKRLSCVLDLSAFDSEASKKRFLLGFAQRLYLKNEDPLHLFLEEADDYIPQRPFRDEAQLLRAWENIVRRGRARGLGMTMITQRSAKINKDVLTQVETLIALRTTSPQDIAVVEAWVKYHAAKEEIIKSLSGLDNGEAWVWSPHFLKDTFRMRFPLSRTFDSGATPKNAKAGERRAPATMADIDLGELQKRMEATIVKAKAEDPRELQREVARLRGELAKARVADPPPDQSVVERAMERAVVAVRTQMCQRISKSFGPLTKLVREFAERACASIPRDEDWNYLEWKPVRLILDQKMPATTPDAEKFPQREPVSAIRSINVSAAGNSDVTPSMRKLLIVLAQNPEGMRLDRLAILAGYTVNGHFNNMVGKLRSAGLITAAGVAPIEITEGGRQALGRFDPLPTGVDLRRYWLSRIGQSKARVLGALFNNYPDALSMEQLATAAGYTINGHFNNMLGSLRTMGLITPPRQPIKAMDYLFEE